MTTGGEPAGAAGPSDRVTAARPPHRIERARAWMSVEALDALVVSDPDLVTWLTGYRRYYGGPSAAVLDAQGGRTLVVARDEVPVAERLAQADRVIGFGERGFGLELDPLPQLADATRSLPHLAEARKIGCAGDLAAPLANRLPVEQLAAGGPLHQLSLVKDADELRAIAHAYELCWVGHRAVADATADGASEIEIMTAAQSAAQLAHGGPIEFVADLLAGPNTADVCCPIAVAGRTRVAPGDPVVADIVVGADGYWGDTCRTYVRGSNDEVRAIHAELAEIRHAAAGRLRPGALGATIYGAMRQAILERWPDGEFPHHGGHGVGLSVFDDPHVIPAGNVAVESWMVLALEPGVYFPGRFGVRTENLYLVTPDGGVELREAMRGPIDEPA